MAAMRSPPAMVLWIEKLAAIAGDVNTIAQGRGLLLPLQTPSSSTTGNSSGTSQPEVMTIGNITIDEPGQDDER